MSAVIVTTAYLGDKENLKTAGISPVIDELSKNGELDKVICQVHKNFYFENTTSFSPAIYRYVIRSLEYILGISLGKFRSYFTDLIASWKLPNADVVIFHPAGKFNKTIQKAKKNKSITVGIATVAHPKFEEELWKTEYQKFGIEFQTNNNFDHKQSVVDSLDYIIAYSDFVKSSYVEQGYKKDSVFVAYSDRPIPSYIPENVKDKKFKVLFVAYSSPRKGLQYLLEAWDSLDLPDSELVIVGGYSGPNYTPKEFKEYCDEIVNKRSDIKWIGKVEDTTPYYKDASLFVFPSLSEGNPKVVMKAMSYGLPVVTTPNAKSIVVDGESGYVVPIRDSEAIKNKIELFYNNRDLAIQMGKEARKAIENKKSFGELTFEIYKEVLSRNKIKNL